MKALTIELMKLIKISSILALASSFSTKDTMIPATIRPIINTASAKEMFMPQGTM
jgi:hypothetical protein